MVIFVDDVSGRAEEGGGGGKTGRPSKGRLDTTPKSDLIERLIKTSASLCASLRTQSSQLT